MIDYELLTPISMYDDTYSSTYYNHERDYLTSDDMIGGNDDINDEDILYGAFDEDDLFDSSIMLGGAKERKDSTISAPVKADDDFSDLFTEESTKELFSDLKNTRYDENEDYLQDKNQSTDFDITKYIQEIKIGSGEIKADEIDDFNLSDIVPENYTGSCDCDKNKNKKTNMRDMISLYNEI